MKDLNSIYRKIQRTHNTYVNQTSELEALLKRRITGLSNDDLSTLHVLYQESDGFVLVIQTDNYPLYKVLDLIHRKYIIKVKELDKYSI